MLEEWLRNIEWPPTIAAIGIIISLLATWWTHRQRATFDMIDGIYELCHRLHSELQAEWRLSHLFCIEETVYREVRDRIATQVGDDKAELIERERLFAIQIFIAYEQAYYQWQRSSGLLASRKQFLAAMLKYFVERLIANPRLRAYLESDECGCSLHLEKESAAYLWSQFKNLPPVEADQSGPFDYAIPKIAGHCRSAS